KRQRKGVDAVTSSEPGPADAAAIADDEGNAVVPEPTKKTKRKKKTHKVGGEVEEVVEGTQPEAQDRDVDEMPQSLKKKSKKRSKLVATNDSDIPDQSGLREQQVVEGEPPHEEGNPQADSLQDQDALLDGEPHDEPEPEVMQSPQSSRKKRPRNKKRDDARSPEAPHLVSHAVGGSPPSAQRPTANGILRYKPHLDVDADEVIPSSEPNDRRRESTGSQASEIHASQLNTQGFADGNEAVEESPEVQYTGTAVSGIQDGDPSQEDFSQDSQWLHKQGIKFDSDEEPITDTRTSQERDDDAALPDLQPSKDKTEPVHPDSESESESPSAARLERLERSRSRSMSRASVTRLADEDLGLDVETSRARSISAPSSTGSNVSIPARAEDIGSRPGSRGSTRSTSSRSSRNDAQPNGDTMDIDQYVDHPVMNKSPAKKQTKCAYMTRNKAANPKSYDEMDIDDANEDGGLAQPPVSASKTTRKGRRRQSDDGVSNRNVHVMADWLSQNERTRNHPVEVEELEHNDGADGVIPEEEGEVEEAAISQKATRSGVPQVALKEASTQETASQPKKARKTRRLQPKTSLSLSQLEGNDADGEGESQARLPSFSQGSKLKDVMRGGSNEPEESESGEGRLPTGGNSAVPQTQSRLSEEEKQVSDAPLPKPKKAKRKRRNDASEDELESLMARNASKSIGLSDEDIRTAKRKRLAKGQKADGRWTREELGALEKVVVDFCDAHDMTQPEINTMIHERPDKSNTMHQEFWSKAAMAASRRTRKQIVERARRLYNNFAGRGHWTEEQKQELHELFEKHGKKFAEIAVMVNRDQKDVRDYWRNQYLVHETQVKARWTNEETERLKEVVEEALNKIRIMRENNDQFRPRPRTNGFDDESLIDWEQISSAMDLTRSRQQCKWKWTDMKEKGVAGDDTSLLPKSPYQKTVNGISEELANAREDYRGMGTEEKLRLIEAIHDCGTSEDGRIRWNTLVNERFRTKWHRPTLKLVWYRLRQAVPEYDQQDVQSNARFLLNYYNTHQSLPEVGDNQVDEQIEERVISHKPGSRIWKKLSDEPRAVRERQRRSSSMSSRASSRGRLVSSQILRIEGSDDDDADRTRGLRSDSVDLGLEDGDENRGRRSAGKRRKTRNSRKNKEDVVPIRIPSHLKGEAAKKALEEARRRANAGQEAKRGARSASVAIDSDSDSE
ncbi:DNA-binding protein REB1, partial [Cytospora mali]